MSADKEALRKALRARRDAMPPLARAAAGSVICKKVLENPGVRAAAVVMAYVSMKSEVDTRRIIQKLLAEGKRVCVPRVEGRSLALSYIGSLEELRPSSFGILEPTAALFRPASEREIDVCLVPGLGFDAQGYRIGYGGGFYDRLLPRLRSVKIGLCYGASLIGSAFPQAHDVPVDLIITDLES